MAVHFEYQGKHYEFADGTTPDVAKQKIQTFLGEQPNTPSEEKTPKSFYEAGMKYLPDAIPDMVKHQMIGLAEGAAHVGTFLPQMFGGAVETAQGALDKALGTDYAPKNHREFEDKVVKGMDTMSYTPKSPLGQDIQEGIGKLITEVGIPMMGIAPGLPNKAHLQPKTPKPILEKFKKIDPAVAEFEKQRYLKKQQAEEVQQAETVRQRLAQRDAEQTANFGVQPDLFAEDILAKQREQAQGELEGIYRDANGPQGDLFAGMGEKPLEQKPTGLMIEDGGPSKRNAPDNMIGEVQEQAQRTLQDVDALQRGEQERDGTYPEQRPDNLVNWQSPKQMEIDQRWEQKKAAEQAEQSAAKETAWDRAEAEKTPLEFEPSQRSTEMVKPGERTTYRPAGQTAFGKGQRGSIGFFGKDKFEKFAEDIKKQYPDATPEEIKAAWDASQSKQKQQQVEQVVGNIAPSLKENLTAYKDVAREDALAALKTSPDYDRPTLGGLRNTILSRGRLGIEKLKNEGVKSALAHMIGLRDAGKIKANQVLHGDNGVMRNMRKLEKFFGPGRAWEVIRQRLEGQFNKDFKFNLDRDQMKIKEQLDKIFDDIHAQMEQLTGKKIHKIPNYFPSMFYGDFVSTVKDADGRIVAYITEKSAGKTKEAVQHVLGEMGEGFTATEPKYRKEILNDRFKGRAGLAQHFEAMLDLLSSDDPVVQRAQESVQNAVAKRAMDTRRVKDRLKFKAGVEGAEGQKKWKKDRENYYAAKDVLENYVRAFEDWKANMETSKFLKEIKDTMPNKKNTHYILQDYFDDMRAVKDANSRMATQIDNAMSNAIGHGVGSTASNFARGTANFLTKLWLGFWNPTAMAQNVLQPMHSFAKLVDLASNGGSKDVISPMLIGFAKSLVDGISIASNGAFKTNLTDRAKYLRDFEVIKPGLIEAKDRTKAGHVIEKNVIAGGQMVSEAFARTTTFNIFETYLEKSGYGKEEAYSLAKNLTHDYMVNYEGYAKAGIVGNTGIVGEMAGRLQSFKINQFTQLANYMETLKKTKNPAPLATALAMSIAMAGVSGMIGMDVAEGIYGLLVKSGMVDPRTRSPRQMAMDLGGAMAFGVPSNTPIPGVGKVWLSGSLTTNLVGDMSWRNLAPIFAGVGQAIQQVPTVARWIKDKATGEHTVPDSEKAQALNTVTPTVFRGRWEDRLLTDKKGRIASPFTGEVMYQKGPQDDNLLMKFTNVRSRERGETVARKALLVNQEKMIKEKIKDKTDNLQKLFDESARMGNQLDPKHVTKQFQDLIDYGNDPNQTVEAINKFIIKNHLGNWFKQQVVDGNITLSNVERKMRAMDEDKRIGK